MLCDAGYQLVGLQMVNPMLDVVEKKGRLELIGFLDITSAVISDCGSSNWQHPYLVALPNFGLAWLSDLGCAQHCG